MSKIFVYKVSELKQHKKKICSLVQRKNYSKNMNNLINLYGKLTKAKKAKRKLSKIQT